MADEQQQIGIDEGVPLDQTPSDDLEEDIFKAIDQILAQEGGEAEGEVEKEPEDDDSTEAPPEDAEATETAEPEPQQAKQPQEKPKRVEEIPAPEGFSAEEKEAFYKAPKKVRQAIKRREDERDSYFTRRTQEIAQKEHLVSDVMQVTNKYLSKWGRAGLTPASAITALASFQDRLTDPDVGTRKQAFAELFVNSALTAQDFMDILEQSGSDVSKFKPQQQPQQTPLTNQDIQRQNYIDSMMQSDWNNKVQSALNQIEAVRNERDAQGRFVWPKLHDQNFLDSQVKPLAQTLLAQQPNLNWGDAVKRAYLALDPSSAAKLADKPHSYQNVTRSSPTVRANGVSTRAPKQASDVPDDIEAQILMAMNELEQGE
jgi:hypothetical protein